MAGSWTEGDVPAVIRSLILVLLQVLPGMLFACLPQHSAVLPPPTERLATRSLLWLPQMMFKVRAGTWGSSQRRWAEGHQGLNYQWWLEVG